VSDETVASTMGEAVGVPRIVFACMLFTASLGLSLTLPTLVAHLTGRASPPPGGIAVHRPAPTFELDALDGTRVSLGSTSGHARFVMFGFLGCDGLCQTQIAALGQVRALARGPAPTLLHVSMDPHETATGPAAQALARRHPEMTFLTADEPKEIELLARRFGAPFRNAPDGERIEHPGLVFLIDADDTVRYVFAGRRLDVAGMARALDTVTRPDDFRAGTPATVRLTRGYDLDPR